MRVYPVKGGEGLKDPRTKQKVPATGLEVPASNWWNRRLVHGDVTLEPPQEVDAPSEAPQESVPALPAPDADHP
jgi:Protein of unknown function (DUF2635)